MDFQVPFRMVPGLTKIPAGQPWLTPSSPGSRHQREKLAVLSRFYSQALLCDAGFDAQPALHAVLERLSNDHPDHFVWDGDGLKCLPQGVAVRGSEVTSLGGAAYGLGDEVLRCVQALPAMWRLPGLLSLSVEEDLAIVQASDSRLRWMAVALPSRWAPEDKIGKSFSQVHAPVADAGQLQQQGAALMRLVCAPTALSRTVWSISPDPWLHAHPARLRDGGWPQSSTSPIPERAWFRVEEQSFMPLPDLGQAVFAIRVRVEALRQAVESSMVAQRLHDSIASMSEAVLHYKGLHDIREPLLRWLRERADAAP